MGVMKCVDWGQGRSVFLAIDLKSFYASVECREWGLDPLTTNLVVADESRTDGTICLAVSPSLKAMGLPGRARLFEVKARLKEIERQTGRQVPLIIARPRMRLYLDYSQRIVEIYQRFISAEDMHVYSVDEVFLDATSYRRMYGGVREKGGAQIEGGTPREDEMLGLGTPRGLATRMIRAVLAETGITATAGIGTNLYLAKVAMDVVAKHLPADAAGVRVAELDEQRYRELLWDHQPLTDFWRIGPGTERRLRELGIRTLGELAQYSASPEGEERLYRKFGVDAELLIDHAWGVESCTMAAIKGFRPRSNSLSTGQVLPRAYTVTEGEVILREMVEELGLELTRRGLAARSVVVEVKLVEGRGLAAPWVERGRRLMELGTERGRGHGHGHGHGHGSERLDEATAEVGRLERAALAAYRRAMPAGAGLKRLTVTLAEVVEVAELGKGQLSLFGRGVGGAANDRSAGGAGNVGDVGSAEKVAGVRGLENAAGGRGAGRGESLQRAVLKIKQRYGKNAILRGISFEEGATARERNRQIGGHRA